MQIYVHKNNQQLGPFTEAEVRAQLAAGTITLADNVWWQGQATWMPLGQTSLVAPGATAPMPAPGIPAVSLPAGAMAPTSKLAIWSLVCGCLSLLCGLFASIPAIILGHMGLKEVKNNPGVQGRGMALAGMILGYVFTTLIVIYLIAVVVLISMGSQVSSVFKTITSQLNEQAAAQAAPPAGNTDDSSTNSDASTNAPDSTTNSAPATPAAPDSTNAPDSTTNAAPMNQ